MKDLDSDEELERETLELIKDKKNGYFFHSKNGFLRIIKDIFNRYPENIAINGRIKIEKEFDIDKIIRDKLGELL